MANPLLGSLVDPFTTTAINTLVWSATTGGGLVTVAAPGRIGIQATNASPTLGAAGPYDTTGQAFYARITPALAGTGGATVTTTLKVQKDASNYASLVCTPGSTWQAVVTTAGTPATTNLPTFDPSACAWWQIAESGGQFLFSTSADGVAWTQVAAVAHSWAVTAVGVYISATSAVVVGQSAYVEHANTLGGALGPMPSAPRINFAVAFNQGASGSAVPSYVDMSQRLRGSWSAQVSGRQYELDQIQSGQLTCTLVNRDGALDPLNTSSPYYPNVVPMRACRLTATWPQTRNLLDPGFASGTSTANIQITLGALASIASTATPTGHTTATSWTVPAVGANGSALGQGPGSSPGYGFTQATALAIPLPGGSGGTVSGSVWVSSAPGAAAGITAVLQLCWYDMTGARIATNQGAGITVPATGTWTQATASFTAPAGAVSVRPEFIITSTTIASNTYLLTAWQVEMAAAPTPWTAPGVTYPLWAGFIERWPQQWDHSGTYGLVDITAVDVLATLADFQLTPSIAATLLALNPSRLYPLDEPSGSTRFRDLTGKHASVTIGTSNLGAGTVTAGSSITGTGSVGSAGPVVTIANPAPAIVSQAGSYLAIPRPNGPPSSGGWARIICFRTTVVPVGGLNASALWWWGGAAGTPSQGGLLIDSNQNVNASLTNAAGQVLDIAVTSVAVCDGNWHMVQVVLFPDGKTLALNVDGVSTFSTSASDLHGVGITTDNLGMNANPVNKSFVWAFSGDLAYACELPTYLDPGFVDMATGFATGWAGETSTVRAQRILALSGYSGPLGTVDATTEMGGASLTGVDAMSALQLVADTENGQVYADASGTIQLAGRLWRYYQNAASVLIGEQQSGGEIPYLDDVAIEFDTTHIYNQVSVTNQGAPGSPAQPAVLSLNATSSAAYAPRTLQRTINVFDPSVPAVAAQYLAQQYGQPLARVAALTVDPASNPALWPQLLALGFGSRVQVSRRPPSGPGAQPIVLQQFLEHLSWSGDDQGNYRAAMQLSSATPFLGWWIVASLHSTIHTAVSVGDTVITLDPLTGASLNPAASVLSAGTVLTLGYGDAIHTENVTVKSVAATTAGYTSVAVTLTAPTVHSHVVGAVVCQPLPGGYTLPPLPAAGFPASLDAGATLSATGPRVTY